MKRDLKINNETVDVTKNNKTTIDWRSLFVSGVITVTIITIFQLGALATFLIFIAIYKMNEQVLIDREKKKNKKLNENNKI